MRKIWIVGVCVVVTIGVSTVTTRGQTKAQPGAGSKLAQEPKESLMHMKLMHAQDLLSALSTADYESMKVHARELQNISLEARWSEPHSPDYSKFGDDFRSALERVVAAADKENIDGAALNYMQVVLTCIQCHKVVREGQQTAHTADLGVLALPQASGD